MAINFKQARWGAAALMASAGLLVSSAPTPAEASDATFCRFTTGLQTVGDYRNAGWTVADFSGEAGPIAQVFTSTAPFLFVGSPNDDRVTISTGALQAVVCLKQGNDTVIFDTTNSFAPNFVRAGQGSDLAAGGEGNDTFKMGLGNDTVFSVALSASGKGNDVLRGGPDNDLLVDFDGFNTINGANGIDTCATVIQNVTLNCEVSVP